MSRPLRIEYESAVYHVTARGNERRAIFRDEADRQRLLETLADAIQRFGLIVHAYCLMPNHYHLLLQTPRANLSRALGWLQTTYSVRFNHRHGRSGHLFQGRFKAQIVDADAYARQLVEYIHLNPVRPRDKKQAIPADRRGALDEFRFSSHRAYAGLDKPPAWLNTEWLSYFGHTGPAARKAYRQAIADYFGQPVTSPWANLRGSLVLGSEAFYEKVKALLGRSAKAPALAWSQHQGAAGLQSAIARAVKHEPDSRIGIWLRVKVGGESMTKLARELEYADGSGISRVVQRLESAAKTNGALRKKLEELRERVMSRVKR